MHNISLQRGSTYACALVFCKTHFVNPFCVSIIFIYCIIALSVLPINHKKGHALIICGS